MLLSFAGAPLPIPFYARPFRTISILPSRNPCLVRVIFYTLQFGSDDFSPFLGREGLGSFDGSADCAVDDELREDTDGAGYAEEDGVVAGFGETVVLEENTGVSIDVGWRLVS